MLGPSEQLIRRAVKLSAGMLDYFPPARTQKCWLLLTNED